ncbi:hypothetical protein XENOCAPTIV_004143 [Xenoophorus captivus]|uniref:Beta-defensin n=1 Tax=Xenoophorus captivus TaxID=1517983 RepID=A0ABV0R820_9TELE
MCSCSFKPGNNLTARNGCQVEVEEGVSWCHSQQHLCCQKMLKWCGPTVNTGRFMCMRMVLINLKHNMSSTQPEQR